MNFYPFAATAIAMLGFYLSKKSLQLDRETPINRSIALTAAVSSLFLVAVGLASEARDPEIVDLMLKIVGTLHCFYLLSTMLVAFVYAQVNRPWILLYLLLHLLYDAALIYAVWTDQWLLKGFHATPWGNVAEFAQNSPWVTADWWRGLVDLIIGSALLFRAWKIRKSSVERKIIIIIITTITLVTLVTFFLKIQVWIAWGYPDYSHLSLALGFGVYFYIIRNYGHLQESRPALQERLLLTLGGITLFANNQGKIIKASESADRILSGQPPVGQNLFDLFPQWSELSDKFAQLKDGHPSRLTGSFVIDGTSYALQLIPQSGFGHIQGVLVLLNPVDSLDSICEEFKITPQEKKVITLVVEGLDNQSIAGQLFISYSTVKNHLHRIYKKTETGSRSELLRLLLHEKT